MRLAANDVARSLKGSWRLLRQESEAIAELDLSRDGFWRSFLAFALMLPATVAVLAALRLALGLSNQSGLFSQPELVAAVITAQVASVLAIPALLIAIAPQLARTPRFTGFVIAWNWAGVVSAGLMAVPAAVFAMGWSYPALATLQALAFAAVVLRLRHGVAKAAFGAESRLAMPVVLASALADYAVLRLIGLV
jgi:hypothetical protein